MWNGARGTPHDAPPDHLPVRPARLSRTSAACAASSGRTLLAPPPAAAPRTSPPPARPACVALDRTRAAAYLEALQVQPDQDLDDAERPPARRRPRAGAVPVRKLAPPGPVPRIPGFAPASPRPCAARSDQPWGSVNWRRRSRPGPPRHPVRERPDGGVFSHHLMGTPEMTLVRPAVRDMRRTLLIVLTVHDSRTILLERRRAVGVVATACRQVDHHRTGPPGGGGSLPASRAVVAHHGRRRRPVPAGTRRPDDRLRRRLGPGRLIHAGGLNRDGFPCCRLIPRAMTAVLPGGPPSRPR